MEASTHPIPKGTGWGLGFLFPSNLLKSRERNLGEVKELKQTVDSKAKTLQFFQCLFSFWTGEQLSSYGWVWTCYTPAANEGGALHGALACSPRPGWASYLELQQLTRYVWDQSRTSSHPAQPCSHLGHQALVPVDRGKPCLWYHPALLSEGCCSPLRQRFWLKDFF